MKNIFILLFILLCTEIQAQDHVLQLRPHLAYGYRKHNYRFIETNANNNEFYFYNSSDFNKNFKELNRYYLSGQIFDLISRDPQYGFSLEYSIDRHHLIGISNSRIKIADYVSKRIYYKVANFSPSDVMEKSIFGTVFGSFTLDYQYRFFFKDYFHSNKKWINRLYGSVGLSVGRAYDIGELQPLIFFDTAYEVKLKKNTWMIQPQLRLGIMNREHTRERLSISVSYEYGSQKMLEMGHYVNYTDLNGNKIHSKIGQVSGINQLKWTLSYPITLYDFEKRKNKNKIKTTSLHHHNEKNISNYPYQ